MREFYYCIKVNFSNYREGVNFGGELQMKIDEDLFHPNSVKEIYRISEENFDIITKNHFKKWE